MTISIELPFMFIKCPPWFKNFVNACPPDAPVAVARAQGIEIQWGNRAAPNLMIFPDEGSYLLFLLRWSK